MSSGNDLVLSGNKPLPKFMLTQIYFAMASLGHNELSQVLHITYRSLADWFQNILIALGFL